MANGDGAYSRKDFEELKDNLKRAGSRLASIKEEMKESLGYVRQTFEVGVTVFGVSWALGKWGGKELSVTVLGVPVELGAALILKGVAFSGLLGEYASDAHNIGDGALSVYLAKKGFSIGREGGTWSQGTASGAAPAQLPQHAGGYTPAPLTPEQMAAAMAG